MLLCPDCTGQGRILAAFMYKVYVNELIRIVANCEYSLSIRQLKLGSSTFADDMTLLTLFPTFRQLLMDEAFRYSRKWRFDYKKTKSGVVTFGEHDPHHFREKNNRSWKLGDEVVEESNEYKNLGIVKNYVGSFQSDVDEAIEKQEIKKGWNDFKWLYRPQKYKPFDIYKIMEASLFTNAIVWIRTLDSKANTNSRARALPKLDFA